VRPVISLENVPVPVPSEVWLPLTVGFWLVLQQTPLAVIAAPPSEVMLPPEVAVVAATSLTLSVVTVGRMALTVTIVDFVPVHPYWFVPVTEYVVVEVGLTVTEAFVLMLLLPSLQS
jgi:hypothetical protein